MPSTHRFRSIGKLFLIAVVMLAFPMIGYSQESTDRQEWREEPRIQLAAAWTSEVSLTELEDEEGVIAEQMAALGSNHFASLFHWVIKVTQSAQNLSDADEIENVLIADLPPDATLAETGSSSDQVPMNGGRVEAVDSVWTEEVQGSGDVASGDIASGIVGNEGNEIEEVITESRNSALEVPISELLSNTEHSNPEDNEEPSVVMSDEALGSPSEEVSTRNNVKAEPAKLSSAKPFTPKNETGRNLRKPMDMKALEELDHGDAASGLSHSGTTGSSLSRNSLGASVSPPSKTPLIEPKALSADPKSSASKSPPKRPVKTPDEDLRDYLAEEEPPATSTTKELQRESQRALQGTDAERAQKPKNHGESGSTSGRDSGSMSDTKSIISQPKSTEAAKSPTRSPNQDRRVGRVDACVEHFLKNPETTAERSPWAVMHATLAYGSDYELIGPNGRVNAIGWMCHNGLCRTQRMFTPSGKSFVPNVGGGVQGHQGQFLAILAQCQVPPDYPIQIGNNKFTVQDLVRYEMATCKERSELTFKLIGLSYYLESNKQWRANDGKVWSIQKLIQEELAQPIVGAACGGTHRLMGFSFALKQRSLQGEPITGQYLRAAKFVEDFISYTWRLQNPDGSFSTNWYESRGNDPNDERKVQTSGHMLEWLMFTVNDEELQSPRVEKAVDFLLSKIYDSRSKKWPIGPRGHATRALALYSARMATLGESDAESASAPVVASIQKESARPQVAPATPAPKSQTAAPRARSASPSQVRTRR
jgi:hypothetical protein